MGGKKKRKMRGHDEDETDGRKERERLNERGVRGGGEDKERR